MPIELPRIRTHVQDWDAIRKRYNERGTIVHKIAQVIDYIPERLGLGHPVTAIVDFIHDCLTPEGLLGETLGIPSPGDILQEVKMEAERRIRGALKP